MASRLSDNAFTSRQALDPGLRHVARFLPRGHALHRGYRVQRALTQLMGNAGRLRNVPVVAVNEHVKVRLHRPTGLPDRAPALLWLARQPWVDPDRVAVGGASGGGHFAAAVAQRAHDRNEVKLAYQMLVYPMLDDRTGANRDGPKRIMWTETDNQLAWQWYLNGADPVEAAPARREDLTGLPAAWIGVGTLDLFYQECVEYGRRLREAGVAVQEEIVPGAFHAFDSIADKAQISVNFFASQRDHLWAALVAPSE